MLGIGGTELVIILIFAFLVFGPDKMPQIGRTLGRAIRQFRNAQEEMNRVVRQEVYDPLNDDEPLGDTLKGIFKEFTGESDKTPKQKAVSSESSEKTPSAHGETSSQADVPSASQSSAAADLSQNKVDAAGAASAEPNNQSVNSDVVVKREIKGESFAQKKARLAREKAERERACKEGSSPAPSAASASSSQEDSHQISPSKDGE